MKSNSAFKILVAFLVIIALNACGTKKRAFLSDDAKNWKTTVLPDDKNKVHSLYLIGDAGKMDNKAEMK